ncbi:MAG: hypothetical protein Q7J64_00115, partial [Elusimicrobiota bacterium]|nr:hypothetical protein [Elusimicrobiota bacterium]
AVIVDVNLSFGLEPDVEDRTLPVLSAAARAHRAGTARMLWSREERLSDTTSSSTLTEFRAAPAELTDRLLTLAAPLGQKIAGSLARETGLRPAPPPILVETPPVPAPSGAAPDISTAPLVAPSTDVVPSPPEGGLPSR